jgi:predicted P-loop ATPase/GTPase
MFAMPISVTAKVTHVAWLRFSFHRRCVEAARAVAPDVLAFLSEVNHKKASMNSD